jgi:hypothetical protein
VSIAAGGAPGGMPVPFRDPGSIDRDKVLSHTQGSHVPDAINVVTASSR